MAVEALCTVFTVPGIGQHRIDARYLYGDPKRPALGCYEVTYDHVYVGEVWHDQDADHWSKLMAKAAVAVAASDRNKASDNDSPAAPDAASQGEVFGRELQEGQ